MRNCLGPAKEQYALRTLPLRHTAAFAEGITVTQRATWNTVVGTPVSVAAWKPATLPISEGGCGVASASDVALVARPAVVLQSLARAEPMLGRDRQMVVHLATEAGLLVAINARLPPMLEPLASWTRMGKVDLTDEDVRRQHWWSSRVTQVKAAALLKAATGRDAPQVGGTAGGQGRRMAVAPPSSGPGALPHSGPLFHATQVAPGGALATSGLRGQIVPPLWRAGGGLRRPRRVV